MNTIYKGLFALIKSTLTGQKVELPEGFALEQADAVIKKQSLIPLVYPGAVQCGISTKTELMQKYQVHYFRHLVTSNRQMQAVDELCKAFEESGVDYMLLKGCNMKRLYPKPEMRAMGDADILIRKEQYDKIRPIVQRLQYKSIKESAYDYVWETPDLYLELHRRLYAASQTRLCEYFGTGWDIAVPGEGHSYHMTLEDEYAYIFSHMAKHFRICGIGARHLIDLYVFRMVHPELDEKQVERIMKRLDMLDFYRNILRMLETWFDGRKNDSVTVMISNYVMNSGSFGTMENKLYYMEMTKGGKKNGRKSRLGSFFDALFPPLNLMQGSYNILFRFPVLLPVYWPVRWVDVLIHRRKNISKKMHIIRDMTDEKVANRERAMEMMGVHFDCADVDDD